MPFTLEPDYPPLREEETSFFIPEEDFDLCEHAVRFQSWVDDHLETLDRTDFTAIYHFITQLSIRYHSWYIRVSKQHQNRIDRRGHRCIFHVFIDTLEILIDASLNIDPAVFLPKAEPEPPPPYVPPGTLLGLDMDPGEEE